MSLMMLVVTDSSLDTQNGRFIGDSNAAVLCKNKGYKSCVVIYTNVSASLYV